MIIWLFNRKQIFLSLFEPQSFRAYLVRIYIAFYGAHETKFDEINSALALQSFRASFAGRTTHPESMDYWS